MRRRLTLLAIALLLLASCGAPPAARRAALPADAVAAVRGAPLTLVIDRAVPAGAVAATYGGEPVPARVFTVEPAPQTAPPRAWRRPGPRWRTPTLRAPASLTLAAVALPADAESGLTLEVAGERRAVRLLAAPTLSSSPAPLGDLAHYAPGRVTEGDHWRLALAGAPAAPLADLHPAQRAAALDLAARWRAGLVRLERADAGLAARVLRALTRSAELSGTRAPAWTPGERDASLLDDLLDPSLEGARLAERARAWLGAQPGLAARVRDPASAGAPAIQVADLAGRAGRAAVSDGRREAAPLLVRAGRSALLPAPVGRGAPEAGELLIVSAGDRTLTLEPPVSRIKATPPGARLLPFFLDLSLPAWTGRAAAQPPPAYAAAGLVLRDASSSSWRLYLECKAPGALPTDRVTVFLGPRDAPAAVSRIARGGQPETLSGEPMTLLRSDDLGDRWTALLSIPPAAVSPDGQLLVGLTREFGSAEQPGRAAWPVALLPWEDAPGRVAIDLTDWYDLSPSSGRSR